ncbi:hypothetical protein BC833DRAFT_661556 [Globomyces pollinis-pini]|nr:hypothetical protein BC833DRAFT_661556 [Globomyces pollinis-pini]
MSFKHRIHSSRLPISALAIGWCVYHTNIAYNPLLNRYQICWILPHQDVATKYTFAKDDPLVVKVNRISDKLYNTNPILKDRQWLYHVFYKLTPYASALTDSIDPGVVRVSSGGVVTLSDDLLAFQLAHEMGHIIANHGQEKTAYWTLLLAAELVSTLFNWRYPIFRRLLFVYGVYFPKSREIELEADLIGKRVLTNAGYSYEEVPEYFKNIDKSFGASVFDEYRKIFNIFLPTHPSINDRIQNFSD